jgi:hypothetical protein
MTEPRPSPVQQFFGGALMVMGALMAGLCGLCTAAFLVVSFTSPGNGSLALLALPIGGIPTAIGVGLFIAGRGLRAPPPRARADPATFD